MKKYNKLTNSLLFITLVFTSFFIWKAQAASPNPKVNIVTIEGNIEHLKPVQLHASVSSDQAYGAHPVLKLEENKLKYKDDQLFTDRIDGQSAPLINSLIAENRSFMRGKTRRADQYIVTDDWVVYTAINTDVYWQESLEEEISISILNKQTKEDQDFSINLRDDVKYLNIHTTHLNYPELSILMTEYNQNDEEKHVISTFDLENPENGLTEQVNFTDKIEDNDYFNVGNTFDKSAQFIQIQSVRTIQIQDEVYEDMYTDSSETTGYFVYDIENKVIIDIPLFEENKTRLFTDHNQIYVAEDLDEILDFYEMNPDTEELKSIGTIQMTSPSIGRGHLNPYNAFYNENMTIFDGKLYAYEQQEFKGANLPVFQVIDLEKNKTLFLGRLDVSEGSKMYLPNIEVTDYQLNTNIK